MRKISRRIGRFKFDRAIVGVLLVGGAAIALRSWLAEHPQHDPWAPLDIRHPIGWATQTKLAALRDDVSECTSVLDRSDISFEQLTPTGSGACARPDRIVLNQFRFEGKSPTMTCPVAVGLQLWFDQVVEPAAIDILGQSAGSVTHFGAYSCRRIYGGEDGPWSEHATGNAIDIAGFKMADGSTVSVLNDWEGDADKAKFLRRVRDESCAIFGTVLSPDYNAAHRDHFHFDQAARSFGVCR